MTVENEFSQTGKHAQSHESGGSDPVEAVQVPGFALSDQMTGTAADQVVTGLPAGVVASPSPLLVGIFQHDPNGPAAGFSVLPAVSAGAVHATADTGVVYQVLAIY